MSLSTPEDITGMNRNSIVPEDSDIIIKFDAEDDDLSDNISYDTDKLFFGNNSNTAEAVVEDKSGTGNPDVSTSNKASVNTKKSENINGEELTKGCLKNEMNYIWISNITNNIKAVDLKGAFEKFGRVTAAKILANGKKLYGYVVMKNAEQAAESIAALDHSVVKGETIFVSKNKPNVDAGNVEPITAVSVKEQESKNKSQNNEKHKPETKSKDNTFTLIDEQRKEIQKLKEKNSRLRRNLDNMQRDYRNVNKKYQNLKLSLKKTSLENQEERKRLDMERQRLETVNKIERLKLDKERTELSKLKLTNNLRDKPKYHRGSKLSRSPPRSRRSNIPSGIASSYKRQDVKSSRLEQFNKNRTPPPPPSLCFEPAKRIGHDASKRPQFPSRALKPPGTEYLDNCLQSTKDQGNRWKAPYSNGDRGGSSGCFSGGDRFPNTQFGGAYGTAAQRNFNTAYYPNW